MSLLMDKPNQIICPDNRGRVQQGTTPRKALLETREVLIGLIAFEPKRSNGIEIFLDVSEGLGLWS